MQLHSVATSTISSCLFTIFGLVNRPCDSSFRYEMCLSNSCGDPQKNALIISLGVGVTSGSTVLMWAKGTTIPCPLCKKECSSCLVLKTDIGDVYACIHCEKYIMYSDKMEEE